MMENNKALWQPPSTAIIPAGADGTEIAQHVRALSKRDIQQMVDAYESQNYEMLSTFVWTKAIAALKRRLKSLGMEFIGEMLGRFDIDANSAIEQCVTDYEAIRLAEDLAIVNSTIAMRLRQTLETITHFAHSDSLEADEEVTRADAENCLRACVQGILSQQHIEPAVKFLEFRKALETQVFKADDPQMQALLSAPYFFKRTTLSALLALTKGPEGAPLSNALANMNVIVPLIWDELRKTEKWQLGETYAELHAAGRAPAVSGLKKALIRVQGFDFVPENLRSRTFSQAAQKVLEAHDGFQNYYNEPAAMETLASLGTSIPMPAFAICMQAVLCVRLGNSYGDAWYAQDSAVRLLRNLSTDRWEYFLNECLPGDTRILYKLNQSKPRLRWMKLVNDFKLAELKPKQKRVRELLIASQNGNASSVSEIAASFVRELGYAA